MKKKEIKELIKKSRNKVHDPNATPIMPQPAGEISFDSPDGKEKIRVYYTIGMKNDKRFDFNKLHERIGKSDRIFWDVYGYMSDLDYQIFPNEEEEDGYLTMPFSTRKEHMKAFPYMYHEDGTEKSLEEL